MDEVTTLENQRIEAVTSCDIPTLEKILSDDLTYTHSTGALESKSDFLDSLSSRRTQYKSISRSDVKVRHYDSSAIITGQASLHIIANAQDIRFQVRFTNVYVKRDNMWRMVAWQSTRVPEGS